MLWNQSRRSVIDTSSELMAVVSFWFWRQRAGKLIGARLLEYIHRWR